MKTNITILLTALILGSGCSKNETLRPQSKSIIITVKPIVNRTFDDDKWLHIIGGKGYFEFKQQVNDTLSLSSVKDSIELSGLSSFNKEVTKGSYDIILKTGSIAIADSFIKFNAIAKAIVLDIDQSVSLNGTSQDGLITIHKKVTKNSPTFTVVGGNHAYKFGLAKDYYYLYVKCGDQGRVVFTETTTNDVFIKDLKVQTANRYDIVAIKNKTAVVQSSKFILSN